MKNRIYILLVFFLMLSCKNDVKKSGEHFYPEFVDGNIFQDEFSAEIIEYSYSKNFQVLLQKLKENKDNEPKYRSSILIGLAEIAEPGTSKFIEEYLKDVNEDVRENAAFAVGEIADDTSENLLINAFATENSQTVRSEIIKAVGRCGTDKSLGFLLNINNDTIPEAYTISLFSAFSELAKRDIYSDKATDFILKTISEKEISPEIKYWGSDYLTKLKTIPISFYSKISEIYEDAGYLYTKINLIKTCINTDDDNVKRFLVNILEDDTNDYRIIISALKSVYKYDYVYIKAFFNKYLLNPNESVSVISSEYFINKGRQEDSQIYLDKSVQTKNWQVKSNMLAAAQKFSLEKNKISDIIISEYKKTENPFEKAMLLKSLAYNVSKFVFIAKETFSTQDLVVSTSGMEALLQIRTSQEYNIFVSKLRQNEQSQLENTFANFFKKAILTGNTAMVTIAAEAICIPELRLKEIYPNTYFIKQAINHCILPRDFEAYNKLTQADSYINGSEQNRKAEIKYEEINLNLIKSIQPDQKIKFFTAKGSFEMKMKINDAPIAVSFFIDLVSNGYYNNRYIHRAVPGFSVQSGCSRGDGWGGIENVIHREISKSEFEEGTVALASVSDDMLSAQWFITLTHSPQLYTQYSIIGEITSGMDIVHKLQVGDKIINAILI